MEIEETIKTLMGVMMVLAVIIVVAVVGSGLIKESTSIKECNPAEYEADQLYAGDRCGFVDNGFGPEQVYCEPGDECMDIGKNICCALSKSGYDWNVEKIGNRCCNVTVV